MNERVLLLGLAVLAVLPTVAGASMNSENVTIYRGERLELGGYSFEYYRQSYGGQHEVFLVGEDTGSSMQVLAKLEDDELYGALGEQRSATPSLWYTITELGRSTEGDQQGLYMDLKITSNRSIFSSASMESSAPDRVILEQGGSTSIPLTLRNDGLTNQTFNLTADTDLEVTYGFQGFNVSRIWTVPGDSYDLTASITVPENAETGMHTVELIGRNRSEVSWTVDVEVRGTVAEREMRFEAEQMYGAVNPGEQLQIPLTVMNSGEPLLRDISFQVTGPDGWTQDIRPTNISSLGQYDRRRAMLTIEAPQDASPGDYFIEASAASANVEPTTKRIRINVSKESNMGPVGLGLMIVSLLALIIVYHTFRRR